MTPKKTRSEKVADDLTRIAGVGPDYSDLLESAGVDTVRELRHRNAEKLTAQLAKANKRRRIVRRVPSQSTVEDWIDKAEGLEPSSRFGIRRARQKWATQNSKLRAAASKKWADQNSNLRPAAKKSPARMPRDDR